MSAKHTPGPLHVGHYSPHVDLPEDYAVIDENGEVVATVWGGDETAEANANLFRAALELLDGLKAAEELLAFHEGSANPATEGGQPVIWVNGEDWQNLLDSTRQLIARAEGGQP